MNKLNRLLALEKLASKGIIPTLDMADEYHELKSEIQALMEDGEEWRSLKKMLRQTIKKT